MPAVELAAGTLEYDEIAGDGPVLVLLHGLAMDGRVWGNVINELGPPYRYLLPTLPFGAHRVPLRAEADLSLRGIGRIVADFLAALDLRDVTLVFNDWGGAQTMIADRLMERVGRLVLTPCEAFENYPPGMPGRMAAVSGGLPGGLSMMRMTLARRGRCARCRSCSGGCSKRGVSDELMRSGSSRSSSPRSVAICASTSPAGAQPRATCSRRPPRSRGLISRC